MTVGEAVSRAEYLMSSDSLWEHTEISRRTYGQIAAALAVKMGVDLDFSDMFQNEWVVPPELLFWYAYAHRDKWKYNYFTAPGYSLSEVEEFLNITSIRIGCLDLIGFLYFRMSNETILSWNGEKPDFCGEVDWAEDIMGDYSLTEKGVMYCLQYITRTVLDLEQPLHDERYDQVTFEGGLSVSAWCETMFSSLNMFELKEDIYYASFPCWLDFLTSYTGENSGRFWCLNFPERIDEYIVWRNENKEREDEVIKALDRAVFVLEKPFLSSEAICLSNVDTVAVLFTVNCDENCINPFLPYAQEVFDTLYPEYLRIKDHS